MKRLISSILSLCIIFSAFAVNAAVIYDETDETIITKGVTQIVTKRFTDNGWYKIFTLRIDLNEEYIALKTLTSPKGVNTRDNVLELARQNNALAALNSDFFQPSGSSATRASALGVVVDNGKMLTTPARGKSMATAAVDLDNFVTMGLWDQYLTITAPNGEAKQIIHVNKYFDEGGLVLYNRDWDEYSPGTSGGCVEMVVNKDNIVTEIRQGQAGVKFEDGSYSIISTDASDTFLTDNFSVGDFVKVDYWLQPNPAGYKMAVGGGTLLLTDGKDAPVTHNISGTHPRSAMGVDKSGRIVYLVAVDGRQSNAPGMTMSELRNYMREIGCYNAINFDGGGSTTFVSKTVDENAVSVKNKVSDGSLRRVANAVGIVCEAPALPLSSLYLSFEEKEVYAMGSHRIKIKAIDEYYRDIQIDTNDVKLSVSGVDGYFAGDVFYPLSSGNATITAEYKNAKGTLEVYIRPKKEEPDTDSLRLAPNAETSGTHIAVLGNTNYSTLLGKLYASRMMEKVNSQADAVSIIGKTKDDVWKKAEAPVIFGEYYYAAYKKNNIIIQLDNRAGGLKKSNPEQWRKFIEQLDNTNVKNVIITLSQPPTEKGFPDSDELALFKRMLDEKLVNKEKNVFVVYNDDNNSVKIENGIRYIGLKGIKDVKATNFTSLKECTYLLISSDGDNVYYQLKTLL